MDTSAGACGAGRPSIWYEGMDNGDGYYIEGRSASQNRHERGESTGDAVICLHRELYTQKGKHYKQTCSMCRTDL